ncbi:MAG: T9SS type A sorting domain-containing protein [Saprospiraceae bacterium]|nr:T9SS type A sorting domain-containing protein [Saprospiraceae bacterium]
MGLSESDLLKFCTNSEIDSIYNHNLGYRDEITIPLVFHVFNFSGDPDKVGISEIYNQVDKLNEAFAGSNYDLNRVPEEFRHLAGTSNIRFCIGSRNINGKIEKGIIFKETEIPNFGDELLEFDIRRRKIKHSASGGSDQWDSDKYINVWVGDLAYVKGTSTFPGILPELKDEEGIVLDPDELKFTIKGKTLIHELGHYFSLLHIWGNKDNECEEDDGVGDTPQQVNPYFGCPLGRHFSCGSSDMYMNYMDYTDENCSLMFTSEQIARIEKSILQYRPQLLGSDNLCFSADTSDNFIQDFDVYQNNDHIVLLTEKPNHKKLNFSVFNMSGKKVYDSVINPGQNSYHIEKKFFSSGIYIFYLRSDKLYDFRKLAIFDF